MKELLLCSVQALCSSIASGIELYQAKRIIN